MGQQAIVVIDDAGSHPDIDVSAAALICAFPGAVRASVLVTSANPEQSADRFRRYLETAGVTVSPDNVGLHLNLSEGPTLCREAWALQQAGLPLMMGKDSAPVACLAGLVPGDQIEGEVRAQLEAFRRVFAFYPTRVDGHQHCHLLPPVADVLARVAPQYGISYTRYISGAGGAAQSACRRCRTTARRSAEATAWLQSAGLRGANTVVGLGWCDGLRDPAHLDKALRRAVGSVEIMSHARTGSVEEGIITQYLVKVRGAAAGAP